MDVSMLRTLIGFFILLMISALSSLAESALLSVSRLRVKHLVMDKVSSAIVLEKLLEQPSRFLTVILFINNLVNIAAASLAAVLATKIGLSHPVAISTGVVTFVILVFGEITPKSFALQHSERIALLAAIPVSFLCKVLYPIAHIFILIANFLNRLIGGKSLKEGPFVTEEELKTLVSVGEEEGVIEEEEKEMIHSIFEFGDTVAREVMVPRTDMIVVESNASLNEVLDLMIKEGHSRVPVYEETVDNIIGIVYAKDLLAYFARGKLDVPLKDLIKEVHYVPESKRISELLRELQKKRQHMAIVVDEYGGTAGLITMEDLLEEIVGEIFDEYDLEEIRIEPIDKKTIRVDGRVSLDEINELLNVKLPSEEIETIGGFVYDLLGKIPAAGEKVTYNDLIFKVEKVERRRISKILIEKKEAILPVETE